jgi:hypothetical protein
MKKNKINLGIFLQCLLLVKILFFPSYASAVPSAYTNNCEPMRINNETNSTLLRDSENCDTVWVLPPTSGLTTLSGFTPSANLAMCKSLKEDMDASRYLSRSMRIQAQKIDQIELEISSTQKEIDLVMSEIYHYENDPKIREVLKIQSEIQIVDQLVTQLVKKLTLCKEHCDVVKDNIQDEERKKKLLSNRLLELDTLYPLSFLKYENLKKQQIYLHEKMKSILTKFNDSISMRMELRSLIQGLFKQYAKLEGGYGHLDYNSGWDENIKKLNHQYGNRFDFKAVPTKNTRIYANFLGSGEKDKDLYLESKPILLDYTFGGLKFVPWGEERTAEIASFPSHLSGSLRLNLLGSCPLYYANFTQAKDDEELVISTNYQNNIFSPSIIVNYEYPAAFKFHVTAKYNLYKMYEKMISQTSRGGLFWKKSEQHIEEHRTDQDHFEIFWKDEDNLYSAEEKKEITKMLRDELIYRVLHNMAIPIPERPVHFPISEMSLPPSGAFVLAKGFKEFCGWNIYCRASSWVLIGLDSLLGGSHSVSSFKSIHDRWASETWSSSEAKWRPATTSFYRL